MIGLDTNVLARFLMEDDPVQTEIAKQWVHDAAKHNETLYISHVVLCELVWILGGYYKVNKDGILAILEELLSTSRVDVEQHEVTWDAVHDYAFSSAGFADCLIRRKALAAGCSGLKTFDQKLIAARLV